MPRCLVIPNNVTVSPFTQSPPDTEVKLKYVFTRFHTHTPPGPTEFAHPPRSKAPFSTGPGRALCCRAGGSRAGRPRSTCCAPSGWCRRGAAGGSAPCAAGSRKCLRFWCSAPTLPPPSCRGGGEGLTLPMVTPVRRAPLLHRKPRFSYSLGEVPPRRQLQKYGYISLRTF